MAFIITVCLLVYALYLLFCMYLPLRYARSILKIILLCTNDNNKATLKNIEIMQLNSQLRLSSFNVLYADSYNTSIRQLGKFPWLLGQVNKQRVKRIADVGPQLQNIGAKQMFML